ncbi:hypothetical protein EDD11_008133 [Mortierella claussenii]|nr:hypothetical protein EDD11_008133 [Mortierella claussenii]
MTKKSAVGIQKAEFLEATFELQTSSCNLNLDVAHMEPMDPAYDGLGGPEQFCNGKWQAKDRGRDEAGDSQVSLSEGKPIISNKKAGLSLYAESVINRFRRHRDTYFEVVKVSKEDDLVNNFDELLDQKCYGHVMMEALYGKSPHLQALFENPTGDNQLTFTKTKNYTVRRSDDPDPDEGDYEDGTDNDWFQDSGDMKEEEEK